MVGSCNETLFKPGFDLDLVQPVDADVGTLYDGEGSEDEAAYYDRVMRESDDESPERVQEQLAGVVDVLSRRSHGCRVRYTARGRRHFR
jgi:hypothetical protein